MAFNTEYPYVDPNRVNTDWILNEMKKLIEEGKELNLKFDELKSYVMNYFASLDLDDTIRTILDEMYEDGRLESLINEMIEKENILSYELYTYFYSQFCTLKNASAQGGCFIDENTFVQCYSPDGADGICRIEKIDLNTGSVIATSSFFGRHANSCAYVERNNELWINHFYNSNTTGVQQSLYSNVIVVLDANNLSTKRTITLDLLASTGIAYISYDNGNIYIASHDLSLGNRLFIYDDVNGNLNPTGVLIYPTIHQIITVIDNRVYALNDLTLSVYNLQGEMITNRQLPVISNDFCTNVNEIEWFCENDNKIFVGISNNRYTKNGVQYRIVLDTLHKGYRYYGSAYNHFPTVSTAMKVDNSYRPYQNGTRDFPFDCVQTALRIGSCLPKHTEVLGLSNNVFDEMIITYEDCNLNNIHVHSIYCNSNVYLYHCEFDGDIGEYFYNLTGVAVPKIPNEYDTVVVSMGVSVVAYNSSFTSLDENSYPVRVSQNGKYNNIGTGCTYDSENDYYIYYYGSPLEYVVGVDSSKILSSLNKRYAVENIE